MGMFTFTQLVVSRAQFLLEKLDARRLLSVSVAADVAGESQASQATEVIADDTVDGDVDPAMDQPEILSIEEPVENLEDVVPAGCDDMGDVPIRYTMMPAENERNLD